MKHFYNFATVDKDFFNQSIETIDVVVKKPEQSATVSTKWVRNQILIALAIEGENHLCEHNHAHKTFISKATGEPYMEGRHLIPLK